MLTRPTLVNVTVFMDRATCTGKEALGWTETYQAVVAEINAIDIAEKLAKETPHAAAPEQPIDKAVFGALDSRG